MLPRQEDWKEMDTDAILVAQKPRNVPYHLQQPLKEWLQLEVEESNLKRSQMASRFHGAQPQLHP